MKKGSFSYKGKLIRYKARAIEYSNKEGYGRLDIDYVTRRFQIFNYTVYPMSNEPYKYILNTLEGFSDEELRAYVESNIIKDLEFREKKKRWG